MVASRSAKKTPLSYDDRDYRRVEQSGLVASTVKIAETDLYILAPVQVDDLALQLTGQVRLHIERYMKEHPQFLTSLVPLALDEIAPKVIQQMLIGGRLAGVGPMAAVAGSVAEFVGRGLRLKEIQEVIVENGGDIYVARQQPCTVAIFAGESPLSGKIGVKIPPEQMPCGVCCSSGTVGHSLSLGQADAVVVVAKSTPLADAAATRLANEVRGEKKSITRSLEIAARIKGLTGVIVISGEKLGAWGNIELVRL